MPLMTVEMFEGRSLDQKRELVQALTTTFCEVAGGNPSAVHILIRDVAKCDWGVGGELCSDKYPDKPTTNDTQKG